MNPQYIITAGAFCFFLLGALHLRMTASDLKNPKLFAPIKPGLLEELQATRIRVKRVEKNFWQTYIGFHFSHSVGVIFYALVVTYCALARPDILNDVVVRVGLVGFGASYVLMARAFWFIIPLIGTVLGVSLIAIGMAMLH